MSFKILGIGEVLWDMLPSGAQMGGAPTNFACHARNLGADASVISRVGNDDLGRAIIENLGKLGLPGDLLQMDESAPTSSVTIELSRYGVPNYVIHESVAWDHLEATPKSLQAAGEAAAICFGTLAQRSEASRASIQRMLAAAPHDCLRVFDINLRQDYFSRAVIEESFHLANVFKLNEDELRILAEMFDLTGHALNQIEALARRFNLTTIALTRGANGSALFQKGEWSERPGIPIEIVDTVGAGDSFTAALVMGLLCKMDLRKIHVVADEVAQCVCSQAGATPPLPKKFAEQFVC